MLSPMRLGHSLLPQNPFVNAVNENKLIEILPPPPERAQKPAHTLALITYPPAQSSPSVDLVLYSVLLFSACIALRCLSSIVSFTP